MAIKTIEFSYANGGNPDPYELVMQKLTCRTNHDSKLIETSVSEEKLADAIQAIKNQGYAILRTY